jgi:hypothetical protein
MTLTSILISHDNLNSTSIYSSERVRPKIDDFRIYLGAVPTEHLGTLDVKVKDCLQQVVKDGIDMKRMLMIIDRQERRVRRP